MPARTNGRVPTQADVAAFLRAAKDRDLRQRVLGELRDRAGLGTGLWLPLLTAGTALFAVAAATVGPVISVLTKADADAAFWFALWFYVIVGVASAVLFLVCFLGAHSRQLKARVAGVWLTAYSEAEDRSRRSWWDRR